MPENFTIKLSDLQPGYQFRQYRMLEQIGFGGQGVVWSALDQANSQIVAVKLNEVTEADQQKIDERMFERHVARLSVLRHPNILPMIDFGLSQKVRYTISPYVAGGSLEDRLDVGGLKIDDILRIAVDIAAALDYLHDNKVIHRDLKPENILIDFSNRIYVADFGLARVLSPTTQAMHTGRGTPPYSPPEQHALQEITPESDIFSFGVMLYEMFTRQLPWMGEKVLGMQQLYSQEELPDPVEIVPELPAQLVTTLRLMTCASPARRIPRAGEAIRRICLAFEVDAAEMRNQQIEKHLHIQADAEDLIRPTLPRWKTVGASVPLSLTRFAYVNLEEKKGRVKPFPPEIQQLMLQTALTYEYEDDYWWSKVKDPQTRMFVSNSLVAQENVFITKRIVEHILNDPSLWKLEKPPSERMIQSLLNTAIRVVDPPLRGKILKVLELLLPARSTWQPKIFNGDQERQLAFLASEDSETGEAAAQLIGRLRSIPAVELVQKTASEERRLPALLAIQETAGSLPPSIKLDTRLKVTGEYILRHSFAQPSTLLLAFAMIFGGVLAGTGLHVFLTYRLPNFLDIERLTISLEHGAFLGIGFGIGILLTKLISERFSRLNPALRLAVASLVGGLVLNIILFTYNVLFLKAIPSGLLAPLGCLLIAFGYSVAGFVHIRMLKILISGIAIFTALAGTWIGYLALSTTTFAMTPILYYDHEWTLAQIMGMNLLTTLCMAIFANLIDLSTTE